MFSELKTWASLALLLAVCDYALTHSLGNGAVRLVGGAKSTEGRLEILIDGLWGTVCNDGFDAFAAMVVCRQLGTRGSALSEVVTSISFGAGPSSQPIHLDEVLCTGNEDNLLACIHDDIGTHDCSHPEDVGIICERSRECKDGDVRLVNGGNFNATAGRVEYCVGGLWGTVCDLNWGDADAAVVCRQLGLNVAEPKALVDIPPVTNPQTPIVLDDLNCRGNDVRLDQCGRGETVEFCSHSNDAGASCSILSRPINVQSHGDVIVWDMPPRPDGEITEYEIQFFIPGTLQRINRSRNSKGTFYVVQNGDKLGGSQDTYFRVRGRISAGPGEWSAGLQLGVDDVTTTPASPSCPPTPPPCTCGTEAPSLQPPDLEGLHFILRGQPLANNSVIALTDVGESGEALICKTNLASCCGTVPNRFGQFYYPDGTIVPVRNRDEGFYRNRADQEIRLHRRAGVTSPTSRFRCEIPDSNMVTQNLYITLV